MKGRRGSRPVVIETHTTQHSTRSLGFAFLQCTDCSCLGNGGRTLFFILLACHAAAHLRVLLADSFVGSIGLTVVVMKSSLSREHDGVIAFRTLHSRQYRVRVEPFRGNYMHSIVLKVFCSFVRRHHHSEMRRPLRKGKLMSSIGYSNAKNRCIEP